MRGLAATLCICLGLPAVAAAQADPTAQFMAGRRAYQQRRYAEAIRTITPLLYPNILLGEEEQIVDAHKVLAISHFMILDRDTARREVVSLLGMRPDYSLDPVAEPPAVVAFFEAVKRELDERARAARERQAREEERRRLEEALAKRPPVYIDRTQVIEKVIDRRLRWPLFLPFGCGQFENGHRRKGWAFLASETTLLAGSVTAWSLFMANQGRWTPNDQGTIDALRAVQVTTGGAFLAVAIWGILDGIIGAPPRESVTVTTKEPRPAAPIPAKANLSLGPGGLVLRGEF
jgi:hypothetical protein